MAELHQRAVKPPLLVLTSMTMLIATAAARRGRALSKTLHWRHVLSPRRPVLTLCTQVFECTSRLGIPAPRNGAMRRWLSRHPEVPRASSSCQKSFETSMGRPPDSVTIKGKIIKVINSKHVLIVKDDRTKKEVKVVGKELSGAVHGLTYEFYGEWETHGKYGEQFQAQVYAPMKHEDISVSLQHIKGIGKEIADRIVDIFGDETIDVLSERSSRRLTEIEGIGLKTEQSILKEWGLLVGLRKVISLLRPLGVELHVCKKISDTYGLEAAELVKRDPYCIYSEVKGISFEKADAIATKLGMPMDSHKRICAYILYTMRTRKKTCHTAVIYDELILQTSQALMLNNTLRIEEGIASLLEKRDEAMGTKSAGSTLVKTVFHNVAYLQLPDIAKEEEDIASFLMQVRSPRKWRFNVDLAIESAKQEGDLKHITGEQFSAIKNALTNQVSVITGGPGTGKTSILRALVRILEKEPFLDFELAAPTGRAADKLGIAVELTARTIHRLLEYDERGYFKYNKRCQLEADFVIVDEVSMLDSNLMASLTNALEPKCHLVLVGDSDQLPSIGPGRVLGDIIASNCVPVTRLTETFRQDKRSKIVEYAKAIGRGDISLEAEDVCSTVDDLDTDKQFQFLDLHGEDDVGKVIPAVIDWVRNKHKGYLLKDIQVLSSLYGGKSGIDELNKQLQCVFQGSVPTRDSELKSSQIVFQKGDKVIQTKNDYEKGVFNGMIGIVVHDASDEMTRKQQKLELENEWYGMGSLGFHLANRYGAIKPSHGGRSFLVDYDGTLVPYDEDDLADLSLAYAISFHKSQGSEYDAIVVVLPENHCFKINGRPWLSRKLLYTAITRGKKHVIIVGHRSAYEDAVRSDHHDERCTLLHHRLLCSGEQTNSEQRDSQNETERPMAGGRWGMR